MDCTNYFSCCMKYCLWKCRVELITLFVRLRVRVKYFQTFVTIIYKTPWSYLELCQEQVKRKDRLCRTKLLCHGVVVKAYPYHTSELRDPSLLTPNGVFQGITQAANYIYRKLINDGILNQAFTIAPVSYLPSHLACQKNFTALFLYRCFSLVFLSVGI